MADTTLKTQEFARVFYQELDSDDWGDIDPYLFKHIGDPHNAEDDEDLKEDAQALAICLQRTMEKLGLQ